jgi:hypothetical protein
MSKDVGYDVYQERVQPRSSTGGAQEAAQPRSGWRRVFGG